jgi:hypothetical protein
MFSNVCRCPAAVLMYSIVTSLSFPSIMAMSTDSYFLIDNKPYSFEKMVLFRQIKDSKKHRCKPAGGGVAAVIYSSEE